MKRLAPSLAVLALVLFTTTDLSAAPGDNESITTVNLTGGANINGVAMVFGPPTIVNMPGVVQAGNFSFGPIIGIYYYYPALRHTGLSGVFTAPGQVAYVSGTVRNDSPGPAGNALVTVGVLGFGNVDGTHIGTSP